jgi:hypothetical protein
MILTTAVCQAGADLLDITQSGHEPTFDRNTQQVRNPPRRTLCAQRLAVLMQRLRAASAGRAKEDRAHDT